MVDMNQFEDDVLFACNKSTGVWRRAFLSGIPGNRVSDVYRIDADINEDLEDFELYQCRWDFDRRTQQVCLDRFVPIRPVPGTIATFS